MDRELALADIRNCTDKMWLYLRQFKSLASDPQQAKQFARTANIASSIINGVAAEAKRVERMLATAK